MIYARGRKRGGVFERRILIDVSRRAFSSLVVLHSRESSTVCVFSRVRFMKSAEVAASSRNSLACFSEARRAWL